MDPPFLTPKTLLASWSMKSSYLLPRDAQTIPTRKWFVYGPVRRRIDTKQRTDGEGSTVSLAGIAMERSVVIFIHERSLPSRAVYYLKNAHL